MTKVTQLPKAGQMASNISPYHPTEKYFLSVEENGDVCSFVELLELIYQTELKVDRHRGDHARLWMSFYRQPHHTLAGVRVAARVCGIDYEVVEKLM